MPQLPFTRLVREITYSILLASFGGSVRFERPALLALQEATEAMLVNQFDSKLYKSLDQNA
jgi:histone H3/H4